MIPKGAYFEILRVEPMRLHLRAFVRIWWQTAQRV